MFLDGQWADQLSPAAIINFYTTCFYIQAVYKWYRRQSSDSDTAIPYICATVGSLLWLRYSIFIQDLKLVLLQSYAVIMQTFFLLAMLFYRSKKRRLMRITIAVFVGIFSLFLFISQLPASIGLQVSGICASGAQIAGSFVCPYLIVSQFQNGYATFRPKTGSPKAVSHKDRFAQNRFAQKYYFQQIVYYSYS
uniref:Sugar transporter SWEET1 n=1 Tax=Ditylenchus dipsaci TaxID=166011 RepID=A0A915E1Z8_9BILA